MGIYIHIPWCLKKCPYCDFNSYSVTPQKIPEAEYITALTTDLLADLPYVQNREIGSIYIGGGTPSLISTKAYARLLEIIQANLTLAPKVEITLEANPGTIDLAKLKTLRSLGINRLSLGIQSFQDKNLKILGRIHDSKTALMAVDAAHAAGFDNLNLDIIYGLPGQNSEAALADLRSASGLDPTHLSWYQLTLEPETAFYRTKPTLPDDEVIWQMEEAGREFLAAGGFERYEISAYCQNKRECRHNLNYWLFGDYLGIGAGAHGKITDLSNGKILRYQKQENPDVYLSADDSYVAVKNILADQELPFEFMLNALRLCKSLPISLFCERTGLSESAIIDILQTAEKLGLVEYDDESFATTKMGKNFLNDLLIMFVAEPK